MQGVKYDQDKLRYDLIPAEPHEDVAKVLTFGAKKYSPDNWKKVPNAKLRYIAAAFRHLWKRAMGQVIDRESGLPHIAHAICCLYYIGWFDHQGHVAGKRVYISGPITGIVNYNREAFAEAVKAVEAKGYTAISPFDLSIVSKHKTWQDYMRDDIRAMMDADWVLLLPGYDKSNGALVEEAVAIGVGIPMVKSVEELP